MLQYERVAAPVYVSVDPAIRYLVFCCWLTEDLTNDRSKWISLNSGFIERILLKKCISVEIAFVLRRCSLCWVSKVCVVESLRFSCQLVCGDNVSRRWGWSLCLVQILGVAVWSGGRCCWRQWCRCIGCKGWMIDVPVLWLTGGGCRSGLEVLELVRAVSRSWTRCWSQRLCNRCPGLFNPWLTGCVSIWPQVLVLIQAVSRSWTGCRKFYSLVAQDGWWVKLELVCIWCWPLRRRLSVSARKV